MRPLRTCSVVLPAAVVSAAAALAASDAEAATVTLSEEYMEGYKGSGFPYDRVTVTDAAGEANDLVVVAEAGGALVSDAAAPLVAGPGCDPEGTAIRCRWKAGPFDAEIQAGGGDDRVAVRGFAFPRVFGGPGADVLEAHEGSGVGLNGGEGDDRLTGDQDPDAANGLTGGPGRDVLVGGPGADGFYEGDDDGSADRFEPNGGEDRLSYAGRPRPVHVDLAAGVGGEPGEGDTFVGIHELQGGAASDVLLGTDEHDEIRSDLYSAGDVVDGRGGDDWLVASTNADRLIGGAGDDQIDAYGGRDLIDAGPGDDWISATPFDHPGVAGVACGDGDDVVGEPKRGTVALDCESVQLDGITLTPSPSWPALGLRVTVSQGYSRPCALRVASRGAASVRRVRSWPASISLGAAPWSVHLRGARACPPRRAPRFAWQYGRVTFAPAVPPAAPA